MEQRIKNLIKEAKYELFHYPVTTKKQEIKYWCKRILRPKHTPKKDPFFWTHALLAQALESAKETEVLKKYHDQWIKKGIPVSDVDNIMNGYTLLYVYEKTGEEKYKQAADRLYESLCAYTKELGSILPYRRNHPTHVYVDALGMVVPFLYRYGSMFQNREAIELGRKQMEAFLEWGMDEVTGLPYHGYDIKTKVKQGIIGWGRAVGWLMLAMADSMEYMTDVKEKEDMTGRFVRLTRAVLEHQRQDGYFSWQLSALEGPKDTSATAMIGYAVKKAVLISKEFGKEVESVESALKQIETALAASYKNGKIYDCSGECEGFSRYPQVYDAYPWSLGPALRFFCTK